MAKEDKIALVGLLLIVLGVAWIHRPSGLIVAGIFCVIVAYLMAGEKKKPAAATESETLAPGATASDEVKQ